MVPKPSNKREVYVGDMSYSYAATDFGVHNGSHVKTITVIKNFAAPKTKNGELDKSAYGKHRFTNDNFKVLVKLPELPAIFDDVYVHTERFTEKNPTRYTTTTQPPTPSTTPPSVEDDGDYVENNDAANRLNNMQDEINYHLNKDETEEEEVEVEPVPPNLEEDTGETADLRVEGDYYPEGSDSDESDGSDENANIVIGKKLPQDVEVFSSDGYEQRHGGSERNKVMVEDFSDYSMHHVKQLTDPQQKPHRHQLRVHASDPPANGYKKLQKLPVSTKVAAKDIPLPMLRSQSYLDISHLNDDDDDDEFFEPLKIVTRDRIIVSTTPPTTQTTTSVASHTPRTSQPKYVPPKNLNYFVNRKLPSKIHSTTQEPYVAPVKKRFSSQVRQAPQRPRIIPTHEYQDNDTPYESNYKYFSVSN